MVLVSSFRAQSYCVASADDFRAKSSNLPKDTPEEDWYTTIPAQSNLSRRLEVTGHLTEKRHIEVERRSF